MASPSHTSLRAEHGHPTMGTRLPRTRLALLSPETQDALEAVAVPVPVAAGDTILTEGERSNHLFIIERGEVAILKTGPTLKDDRRIDTLGPGDLVGELSFIDGRPRSASARAETEGMLLRVDPFALMERPDGDHFFDNLRASVAVSVVKSTRKQADRYTESLERELKATRAQRLFGQFVVYIIIVLSLGALVTNIVAHRLFDINVYTETFTWTYGLILLIPTFAILWRLRLPLHHFGVTRERLGRSLIEGTVASAATIGLALVAVGATWVLPLGVELTFVVPTALFGTYLFSSFLQEFIARGLIQRSFQEFLQDKVGFQSVLLTSVIFAMLHLHFGLFAFFITLVSSLVFGAFFLRHQNLAGVTLLHFTAGICATAMGLL